MLGLWVACVECEDRRAGFIGVWRGKRRKVGYRGRARDGGFQGDRFPRGRYFTQLLSLPGPEQVQFVHLRIPDPPLRIIQLRLRGCDTSALPLYCFSFGAQRHECIFSVSSPSGYYGTASRDDGYENVSTHDTSHPRGDTHLGRFPLSSTARNSAYGRGSDGSLRCHVVWCDGECGRCGWWGGFLRERNGRRVVIVTRGKQRQTRLS